MKDISEMDISEQLSENSRASDTLCGKATIRSRSLKMSPSPHTPSTPDARFPEANARINYEPCSNRRTEKRCAAGANGVAEGDGHPYYGRTQDTRRFLYIPLFLSLPVLSRPRSCFFFISASRLCLTSVAKFFRPATIIAPWRSRRWRRKTGFGLRLSCLRIYRDAMHQHVIRRESVRKNHILGEGSSDVSPKLEP